MAENINIQGFELTEDEMKAISALNKNRRFNDPGHFAEAAFGTFFPIYEWINQIKFKGTKKLI